MRAWYIYWYSKYTISNQFLLLGGTRLGALGYSMRRLPLDPIYMSCSNWRHINYSLISYGLLPTGINLKANKVGPRVYNLGINTSMLEVKDFIRLYKRNRSTLDIEHGEYCYPTSEWGILGHSKTHARYGINLISALYSKRAPFINTHINEINTLFISQWESICSINAINDFGLGVKRDDYTFPLEYETPQLRANRLLSANSYLVEYDYSFKPQEGEDDISSEILDNTFSQISLEIHSPVLEPEVLMNLTDEQIVFNYEKLFDSLFEYPEQVNSFDTIDIISQDIISIPSSTNLNLSDSSSETKLISWEEHAATLGMSIDDWTKLTEFGNELIRPGSGLGTKPFVVDYSLQQQYTNLPIKNELAINSINNIEHRKEPMMFPSIVHPHYSHFEIEEQHYIEILNLYNLSFNIKQSIINQLTWISL